ncbi:MAG: rRNA methyltransferase [Acidimicrobiales bacterium]|nr:rRNA methyltransferase [Acidimicrobiales bacterium]
MALGVMVEDPDDPRLADYLALNDPAGRRRVERAGQFFVVEGTLAIERLLTVPGWQVRSLLLLPRVAERLAERLGDRLHAVGAPVLVAPEPVLRRVVGFDLHRGALASVDRKPPAEPADVVTGTRLLLALEGVNDHENLGSLYRNAAAFGVGAVLLDPTSADPFYRRSVRVSMGHVLGIPTGRLEAFPAGVEQLHALGATVVALTPAPDAVALRELDVDAFGGRPVVVLVGAEGPGLTATALDAADVRVRIPMAPGIDSLNVATAAAIVLHHLTPANVE